LVSNPESDSSDQEVDAQEWNPSQVTLREICRQNHLIEDIEDELLQSVGQDSVGLLHDGLVSGQGVDGGAEATSGGHVDQTPDDGEETQHLIAKSPYDAIGEGMEVWNRYISVAEVLEPIPSDGNKEKCKQ